MDTTLNITGWSTDHWNLINRTVTDEVNKVSVAGAFLPIFGPLPGSAEDVRHQNLQIGTGEDMTGRGTGHPLIVDDTDMLKFWTNTVYVSLKQQQMVQKDLGDALLAFRRAANLVARAEDAIVFNGLKHSPGREERIQFPSPEELAAANVPPNCHVTGGEPSEGLYDYGQTYATKTAFQNEFGGIVRSTGEALVRAIATSITTLEADGHLGPFACIMGTTAYVTAYTPDRNSLVLPSDRIQPMLGTTILRSGTLDPNAVIVVALAGGPIDIVVATTPVVQFLQINLDARYIFRVYERFVLRVKERETVSSFKLSTERPSLPLSNAEPAKSE